MSRFPPSTLNNLPFARISSAVDPKETVIEERLTGVPVYALNNSADEFVLVSGVASGKSLGFFCFKEEDASALLDQMRSMNSNMKQGSKVVVVALNKEKKKTSSYHCHVGYLVMCYILCFCGFAHALEPAIYLFGSSVLDMGNNNYIPTGLKANYYPYGIDFSGEATGRYTNGKNAMDFIVELLGVPTPKPSLSLSDRADMAEEFLKGVNFASGGAGILDSTFMNIYFFGGRKFVTISSGAQGCLPMLRAKTATRDCHKDANLIAKAYNKRLASLMEELQLESYFGELHYSFFDLFAAHEILYKNRETLGFGEGEVACCGTGPFNGSIIRCTPGTVPCSNRTDHIYWDNVHYTERFTGMFMEMAFGGSAPYVYPINVKQLRDLPSLYLHTKINVEQLISDH